MPGTTDKPSRVLASFLAACDDALHLLDGHGDAAATPVPSVSAWSPLQHLEHVALSNRAMARAVRAIESGQGERGVAPVPMGALILRVGRIPRGRARHVDAAAPRSRPEPDEVRLLLEEGRAAFEVFAPQMEDLAEREETVSHFSLGAFRALEWIRFADVHSRHHMRIARRILKRASPP
jgi:hypothetical protein